MLEVKLDSRESSLKKKSTSGLRLIAQPKLSNSADQKYVDCKVTKVLVITPKSIVLLHYEIQKKNIFFSYRTPKI